MITRQSTMLGSVEILVTPEQMYSAADLIGKNILSSRTAFDSILDDIRSTSSYWEGDAADKERQRFEKESGNFDAMIKNLNNYVTELKLITGIYEANENASVMIASSLPTDVLS